MSATIAGHSPEALPHFHYWFIWTIIFCTWELQYDKIIVLGDLNIHVDKETDSKAIECMNILCSLDFFQYCTGPTHTRGHTLDLVSIDTQWNSHTVNSPPHTVEPSLSLIQGLLHAQWKFTPVSDKIIPAPTKILVRDVPAPTGQLVPEFLV